MDHGQRAMHVLSGIVFMFLELKQNNESGAFKLMYCLDEFTGNLGAGSDS
jgi:hypothetical protein